jgi:hypothetical protein
VLLKKARTGPARDRFRLSRRLRARGAELVGELERYKDIIRLCSVRGPEGIIIELAERVR